jgi:hypothetical protein
MRTLSGDAPAGGVSPEATTGRIGLGSFKYPAESLALLREKFVAVSDDSELSRFLRETGCLSHLGA